MRLTTPLSESLEINDAAKKIGTIPLSRMPHLISDRSLVDSSSQLADHTRARFGSSYRPASEIIFMPKKGYGPRPVVVMAPESRTLYQALVDRMAPQLPVPSRAAQWSEHESFGLNGDSETTRLVDFDISACYEYIDHRLLSEELLLQTLDTEAVDALSALLREFFPRGVGLPQASIASDLLADSYLGRLERSLIRSDYELHRYADDFRIVSKDWGKAHEAIEQAVSQARLSGLVLADGKTHIRSLNQIRELIYERESLLASYRAQASDDLRTFDFEQIDYDDFERIEVPADPAEIDFVAHLRIVEDWVAGDREQRTLHARFGSIALKVLQKAPARVADDWLLKIVERDPIRLPDIVNYLVARPEVTENWSTLSRLTTMPRESPWARLWIASVADRLPYEKCAGQEQLAHWATGALRDRNETIRAEAAWFLAGKQAVTVKRVAELFVDASDVTHVGLAAVAGRLSNAGTDALSRAVRNESNLTKAAFDWGISA